MRLNARPQQLFVKSRGIYLARPKLFLGWDREFESTPLQRRVTRELLLVGNRADPQLRTDLK